MDKKRLDEFIEKIGKDKKLTNVLIAVLIIIMIYMVASYFMGLNKDPKNLKTTINEQKKADDKTQGDSTLDKDYEFKEQNELKSILKQVAGVGKVEVKLYFESGEIKVPAVDSNSSKSTTEETDKEGGRRVTNQNTDGSKVVVTNNSSGNEPLIVKTYKPKITGVVVVAEGAENSKIKYALETAVSKLYDLSMDKVNVFSMEKEK
ncbi:stage III sporulation protein AG [Clostridium cavendishii DSM 21758]|uniref:Stage III sporulation protein AG n=1 Tax=Clostridium cavendishii DSM 21758 TaxID=1121302 RepID=A0A1M6KKK1_9CLOT|nr:stage III sporulation protein AG [Clostridium cavendishii]SHJ59494.1 stage III sporulation protein AG [Clostridium cavendishii DSM 21758]